MDAAHAALKLAIIACLAVMWGGVCIIVMQIATYWCRKLTGNVCHLCGHPWFMEDGLGGPEICTHCFAERKR